MFKWICKSNDGCYENNSERTFNTQEEAYNSMRDNALEKMKWNTDYNDTQEDCGDIHDDNGLIKTDDGWGIGYNVHFYPHKIVHESYSGVYTYEIVKV